MSKSSIGTEPVYDARTLGKPRMFILGLQHMFAMFGATVLVPALSGLDVATTLLFAGIGTLLFHLLTKGKVPAFLGSSFAFIGGYNAVRTIGTNADGSAVYNNDLLAYACFGVAIAGLMYIILSTLFKIFAEHEGAVAAPTAGMHFSKHLMKRMEIKGIDRAFVTLHVGLGNFRTVDVEDLSKHKMDSEQFFVTEEAAGAVDEAKRNGRKVAAIGTTVMRTLETAVSTNGMIKPMEGWTNKFIFAPYEFTVADAMVTNFHLPYSTQLMMVAAFGGYETIMNAYKIAKEEGYRFGTYGDAMLIL